jgi:hypothetical protein
MARPSDSPERRQASRFPAAGTIRTQKGVGAVLDVSTTGVFFEADEPYAAGEPVSLSLVLEPPLSAVRVRLQGTGHVIRVEPRGRKNGIAVAVTWGVIEREPPPPTP